MAGAPLDVGDGPAAGEPRELVRRSRDEVAPRAVGLRPRARSAAVGPPHPRRRRRRGDYRSRRRFGSIYPTPRSHRRSRVRVWEGLTRSTIATARAFGVRSGAAPPPPSDDGGMAPPRSFCAFSFLAYIISPFVFYVYTAHRFASLSLIYLTTLLP